MKNLLRAYNGHVLIVTFLIGLFAAVLMGIQQSLANTEASVKGSLSVVVFLQNSVSNAEALALVQTLKTQDPELLSIDYMSKEQAYQEAMKDPNLSRSLLLLKSNPLPASVTLRYSDRAWWERSEPAEKIKTLAPIQDIRWDPQARSLFISLHRWRQGVVRFSMFVGMLLVAWAFFGLYRVLLLHSALSEVAAHLFVGLTGGALAWGLWGMGLHSIQAEISALHPARAWCVPLLIGMIVALGCYGLDVRHAD